MLGIASILLALAGSLVAYYYSPSRGYRVVSTPVFWLGVMTLTCGLHRMCPVRLSV